MNADNLDRLTYLIIIVLLLILVLVPQVSVPTCPEDAVLVGTGAYDNGHYYQYECGPALDNFIP